jgi:thiosulfate/3-mercaptopyruvate sulfurtransferase
MRERATYKRIGVAEAQALLSQPETIVLDVRDAQSFAKGHITGARNITANDIPSILSKVAKPVPLLICCYHGNASQEYARIFCDFGFLDVSSLDGGFEAWHAATA